MSNTRDYGKGGTRKRLDVVPQYFAGGNIHKPPPVIWNNPSKDKDLDEPDDSDAEDRYINENLKDEPASPLKDIPVAPSQDTDPIDAGAGTHTDKGA